MTGYSYKTTAKALQGRRLVTAGIKAGAWRAGITEAGRYYLDNGCYPPGLWPGQATHRTRTASRPQPAPKPAARRATQPPVGHQNLSAEGPRLIEELAENLVAEVLAAGGTIEAYDRLAGDFGHRVVAASKNAPNLPSGKQLRIRDHFLPSRPREVYLDEDFTVRVNEQPVPVPERVARLHPVAASYRQDADRQEVSKDSLTRATHIVHALAGEAQRRGHDVTSPRPSHHQHNSDFIRSLKDGQLAIGIGGFTYTIRIREQQGLGATRISPYDRNRNLPRWRATRQTTFVPTGRLQITIGEGYGRDGRQAEFRDTKTRSLEERLPAVLRELEIRALEDDWRRQDEQRKAQAKRRRWEEAMARARLDFRRAALAAELADQLERRRLVGEIGTYLTDLRAVLQATEEGQRAATEEWIDWIDSYCKEIDPIRQPPSMPSIRKPSSEDLQPFLHGWSPYGPDSR